MSQKFNQKGENEASEENITKNDAGKYKCESNGKVKLEKQVEDCKSMKHSQLSNGTTEKSKEETKECNRKALQEERNRDTRKRRNFSVSESEMSLPAKRKPSVDQHQCNVHFPSNATVQYIKDRSSLPFPGASRRFYAR